MDLYPSTLDEGTSFRLEFNQYIKDDNNKEKKNTLFALLYQNENDTTTGDLTGSYFYVVVNNDARFKINAYSLKKLINIISPGALEDKEETADLDINELIPSIVSMFITSGTKTNNDFTFHIDVQEAWKNLSGLLSGLLKDPAQLNDLLGIDIAQYLGYADQAVAAIFANLTYNVTGEDGTVTETKPVDSLSALLIYVDQNIPKCEADLTFYFDESDLFTNAAVKVNYADADKSDMTNHFVLDIPVLAVAGDSFTDVTGDFVITEEDRQQMEAINILKLQLNGRVIFTEPIVDQEGDMDFSEIWGSDTLYYNWSVNMDLNPFVLLSEKGFLVENLEKIGYFDFTIDMPAQGLLAKTNVFSLHSDFASGLAYFNLTLPAMGILGLEAAIPGSLSGVFELQGLVDYISGLISSLTSGADNVADISIGDILSNISLGGDGLKISNVPKLIDALLGMLGLGDDIKDIVSSLALVLLTNGGNSIALTVNDIKDETLPGVRYGVCERKDASEIPANGFSGMNPGFITNATPVNDVVKTTYDYGEEFRVAFDEGIDATGAPLAKMIYITGKGQDGTKQYGRARYTSSNFNPYQIGKQTVKVYYSMYTKWHSLIGMLAELLPQQTVEMIEGLNLPFGGIQSFDIEVEVLPPVEEGTSVVVPHGTNVIGIGENVAEVLNAYLQFGDREVKITSDMISCPGVIDSEGNAAVTGNYSVKVEYLSASAYIDIVVGGVIFNDVTTVHIGENVNTRLSPRLQTFEDGRCVYAPVGTDGLTFTYDGNKVNSTVVFTSASSWTIKNSTNIVGHKLVMSYSYELYGVNKTAVVSLKIGFAEGTGKLSQSAEYSQYISAYDSVNGFVEYEAANGLIGTLIYIADMGTFAPDLAGLGMWLWSKGGNPLTAMDMDLMMNCGMPEVSLKNAGGTEVLPDASGRVPLGNYTLTVKNDGAVNSSSTLKSYINVTALGSAPENVATQVGAALLSNFKTPLSPYSQLTYNNGAFSFEGFDKVGIDIKFYTDYGTERQKEVKLIGAGYLDVGEYTAVSTYNYLGNKETYTTALSVAGYIAINEEHTYSQINIPFNGMFTAGTDYFKYGESGYGFYYLSGGLNSNVNFRFVVTDADGKTVELTDGAVTKTGVYDVSMYYSANGVEFKPIVVRVTLSDQFTGYEGTPSQITDDMGAGFRLMSEGNVISDRIAYFGAEKGYRYADADSKPMMDYEVEFTLLKNNSSAAPRYGTAAGNGAQRIYADGSSSDLFSLIATITYNGVAQTIATDTFTIADFAKQVYSVTDKNMFDLLTDTYTNINYGGVKDAALIYNAERRSYGVNAPDGSFLPLALTITDYSGKAYEMVNGRISNFTDNTDRKISVYATLSGVYDGVSVTMSNKTQFSYKPYIQNGASSYKLGTSMAVTGIKLNAAAPIAAHIGWDNSAKKFVAYDANNKAIAGTEVTVASGSELLNAGMIIAIGDIKLQLKVTLETGNVLLRLYTASVFSDFASCYTFTVGKTLNIYCSSLSLGEYNAAFKFVKSSGWGYYDNSTQEKISVVSVKFYYQANASTEKVELTLDENGQIPADKLLSGKYTLSLSCDYNGVKRTVEKTAEYTAE